MDIEHLNKTQIVLLTLLVSFVTSIATGIATVSLIEKAPADVTRVISRIIEQPIETIVPGEKQVVTQTVVVQESDLIARAIASLRPSVVRIYQKDRFDDAFIAMGVIVDAQGTILTDANTVKEKKQYSVALDDGTQFSVTAGTASEGLVSLTPVLAQEAATPTFVPATQTVFANLVLGQTVVALGGSGELFSIAPGVIAEIDGPAPDEGGRGFVRTTITSESIFAGSPLVTTKGEVIGIAYPAEIGMFRAIVPQTGIAE